MADSAADAIQYLCIGCKLIEATCAHQSLSRMPNQSLTHISECIEELLQTASVALIGPTGYFEESLQDSI